MRKFGCIGIAIIIFMLSISARADGLKWSEVFDSEEVEFETLHTTGYLITGTTATGGTTRPGIGANNKHVGELAVVYTLEGEYLTTIEITDTGGSEGMKSGKVLDVWFGSKEEAKEWMRRTGGKIKVRWIQGEG